MKKMMCVFMIAIYCFLSLFSNPAWAGIPDPNQFYGAILVATVAVGVVLLSINLVASSHGYSEMWGYIQQEATNLKDIDGRAEWYLAIIISDETKVFLRPDRTSEVIAVFKKGEEKIISSKIENTEGRWYVTKVIKKNLK